MKRIFTLFILVLSFEHSYCQTQEVRTVSGRLTASDGTPLPGVSILVKGTSNGTTTDANGNYSIDAPVGSTLVYAFIGMQTREVVVTRDNLQPAGSAKPRKQKIRPGPDPIPFTLLRDTVPEAGPGVAMFTDQTPSYRNKNPDPSTIKSIRTSDSRVVVKTDADPNIVKGFGLQFSSTFGLEAINKLPSLQSQFAQGRMLDGSTQWRGADDREIFSWGPSVNSLEYDGSRYDYDRYGKLVPTGNGNGKAANRYNPLSFFRKGFTTSNELSVAFPTARGGMLTLIGEKMDRSGIIQNSRYNRLNFSGKLKSLDITESLTATASVSFNRSAGDLLMRGSNYASVIGSVLTTPVTFDNTNGYPSRIARNDREAFYLPDGSVRSYAPGFRDNPYGLANELPDRETMNRMMVSTSLNYAPAGRFSLIANASSDRQSGTTIAGTPFGYSGYTTGRLYIRAEESTQANVSLTPSLVFNHPNGTIKASASWMTQLEDRKLARVNAFDFPDAGASHHVPAGDSITRLLRNLSRITHELALNALLERHNWLTLRLGNRHYFSNTLSTRSYTNLFPSASVSVDLANLIGLWPVDGLKVYSAISRSVKEVPLIYNDWAYASTRLPVQNYQAHFEGSELFFRRELQPETERKFEAGIKGNCSTVWLELSYFNTLSRDGVAPVWTGTTFHLDNVGSIISEGAAISAEYFGHLHNGSWGVNIKWTCNNTYAEELYTQEDRVPLSGFQSVQKVLAADQPVGAIFGSRYLRDIHGRKIIGSDGFPVESDTPGFIGNPIPDWTMGLSSYFNWRNLRFALVLDVKKGGDIWNGTRAILDYTGTSMSTGDLRNTVGFVFDGVDMNGLVNTTPVNFSDANNPDGLNRWTRYGWDGVAEDYIEDGSWIRVNEAQVSYTVRRTRQQRTGIREFIFSLGGRNLLVITPYTGVDPASTLFGYGTGAALDLFNAPSTRSYNAQLTIKI